MTNRDVPVTIALGLYKARIAILAKKTWLGQTRKFSVESYDTPYKQPSTVIRLGNATQER